MTLVLGVLEQDAYDEPAVREAMRLLLSLGKRAQAATLYERFRAQAATQALAARVLRGLDAFPDHEASRLRADTLRAPLVGREVTWLQLSRSQARLSVLVGEPGVGKTRLATDFAAAHGAGLLMRGRDETRHTPFYPVAQLIREALATRTWSPDVLDEVWRLEVARLVPECLPGVIPPTPVDAGRARFLDGLSRAVMGVLGGQLLVLDDLHWVDDDTMELVAHIVRTLDSLRRDGLAATLTLEPLQEGEVLALVQSLSGAGGGVLFARRLHAASSGNPLYLLELLRGCAGGNRGRAGGREHAASSVAGAVRRSVTSCGDWGSGLAPALSPTPHSPHSPLPSPWHRLELEA